VGAEHFVLRIRNRDSDGYLLNVLAVIDVLPYGPSKCSCVPNRRLESTRINTHRTKLVAPGYIGGADHRSVRLHLYEWLGCIAPNSTK
jgi:hypothetical protein